MNKTQTKRLTKLISALETTGLAVRAAFVDERNDVDLYEYVYADRRNRPTIGALAAKLDRSVGQEQFLSNVGRVAMFLENLGLGKNVDLYDAAERIVGASAATHSPVQNAKRALAALYRVLRAENVTL